MNEVICYHKHVGQTPLEAIRELKKSRPEFSDQPITYAGRLDPMAEGLLLLLVGEAVHRKDELLGLNKTYHAKILLGLSSDSYDILGLVNTKNYEQPSAQKIKQTVSELVGKHEFPYPTYSSKPVEGKPLWQWMKEGQLSKITIPLRIMNVLSVNISNSAIEKWEKIFQYATTSIHKVSGDFRQTEVLKSWEKLNQQFKAKDELTILNINFEVSSGTYIRTLAHELGKKLNCPALLYQLNRTSIGSYKI
jgi:tRNA pseudouridine55 synthase